MVCPQCGYQADNGRYCADCGLRLRGPGGRGLDADDGAGPMLEGARDTNSVLLPPIRAAGPFATSPAAQPAERLRAAPQPRQFDFRSRDPASAKLSADRSPSSTADLLGALAAPALRSESQLKRHRLALGLLELARSGQSLERAELPREVAAAFLRRYHGRSSTQEAYAGDLADWFVWLDHAGIDPFQATLATVESYSREPLASGRPPAPATVARRLACLSHYYRRALYGGHVPHNPVEQAHRPKVPEPAATLGLSKQRAQELIRAARAAGRRDALLVLLMLELGLRVSEAVGADIEDLGEQGRHQVLAVKGKGQLTKATLVPLNSAVIAALAAAVGGRTSGPLLATATGRRLTRQHAGKLIKRLGTQIGLPGLHPHELRHAFVTLSLDEGESLRDVQDAARHADPRTTRRYDRNRNNLDRHPTHRLLVALEP